MHLLSRVVWVCALAGPLAGPLLGQDTSPTPPGLQPAPSIRSPTAAAPDSQGPVLTLTEAQQLARHNNPAFLQSVAVTRGAGAAVRAAYGGLLPQATASLSGGYQQAGQVFFSGSALGSSSNALQSQWALGLSYQLSASTLLTPAVERANRDATEADVTGTAASLEGQVASQYVSVVEDQARAALQDSLVADARVQLQLAQARVAVGSATQLDQRRAEVALGQQQVSAIQAHTTADIDKLRLFQVLGVPQPAGVQLHDDFPVAMPSFTVDSVMAIAHRDNPQVNATRAREHAADVGVRRAHGLYTPTLSLSTGIGGYTYQYTNGDFLVNGAQGQLSAQYSACLSLDTIAQAAGLPPRACGPAGLTPAQAAAIRSGNRQFPFGFTNTPRQFTATISLPLFDGFLRERTVEQAEVDRDNARYNERARELQLTADVTSAYLSLETAVRTEQIQAQNAAAARDALTLAEERYRVGGVTFVDVSDARAAFERAENDHISAVYDYHKAFAALESAVGRRLR
jgi:outer membrane protein